MQLGSSSLRLGPPAWAEQAGIAVAEEASYGQPHSPRPLPAPRPLSFDSCRLGMEEAQQAQPDYVQTSLGQCFEQLPPAGTSFAVGAVAGKSPS